MIRNYPETAIVASFDMKENLDGSILVSIGWFDEGHIG